VPSPTKPNASPSNKERIVVGVVGVLVALFLKFFWSALGFNAGADGPGSTTIVVILAATGILSYLGSKRLLDVLSSVRFGIIQLILLASASMAGMLIMQQNVEGFDKYYAELSPATKFLFGKLGFFDIYHVWYFNGLLLILSLNIVLASIDRFPTAWTYISRKKLDASAHWLRGQEQSATVQFEKSSREEAVEKIASAMRASRMKATVTEKKGKTFVFGERGAWNRLGAYAVHVALLTIFFGGFLTSQFGRTGVMPLAPGQTSREMVETVFDVDRLSRAVYQLPFDIECTDIQQKLMRKEGAITSDNTLDWLTRIKIKDAEAGVEREALVHLNAPFDYRGYRFFQASFDPTGSARQITLRVTPQAGGQGEDITIPRGGSTTLADGTRVEFKDFLSNFTVNGNNPDAPEGVYTNPAAILNVKPQDGAPTVARAFTPEMAERAPFAKQPVAGYTWRLIDFEKAPRSHTLSIQKDPGATIVYLGFAMLGLTLGAVFFFSHERVWAHIDEKGDGNYEVVMGGNTNRNRLGFGDRFKKLIAAIGGEPFEVKKA
jgi:cytochrome c biogenesis protein